MKHYHHVTDEERFYIWNASREGVSQKKIAETLGRHPSTISREMKRNRMPRSLMYTHYWACEMVKWRKRRVADTKHRKVTKKIGDMIERLVQQYLSPEQVCGYLKEHHDISLAMKLYTDISTRIKSVTNRLNLFCGREVSYDESAMDLALELRKYRIESALQIAQKSLRKRPESVIGSVTQWLGLIKKVY